MIPYQFNLGLTGQSKHVRPIFYNWRNLLIKYSASRGVHDVTHKLAAVGSRTVEKAQEFINKCAQGDKSIKAYGTYEEVYVDKASLLKE